MTYFIQISFDRGEPVKYLSEDWKFVGLCEAQKYNEHSSLLRLEYECLCKMRSHLIVKIIPCPVSNSKGISTESFL